MIIGEIGLSSPSTNTVSKFEKPWPYTEILNRTQFPLILNIVHHSNCRNLTLLKSLRNSFIQNFSRTTTESQFSSKHWCRLIRDDFHNTTLANLTASKDNIYFAQTCLPSHFEIGMVLAGQQLHTHLDKIEKKKFHLSVYFIQFCF